MSVEFKSRQISPKAIKINGKIKKAIDAYKKKKVPMNVLMTNFLAVKSKGDELAKAENPWAYFYKGIEGHEVESGVSLDETLFRFATMEIRDQNPTDVINAAFFSNKVRNDSEFEIGYMIPMLRDISNIGDRILVVNPSPDIVCEIENSKFGDKHIYSVVDSTVASLYKIQFPKADFCTFEQMDSITDVDVVLITNRDQKADQACIILRCLECCKDSARILGLVPSTWFDNPMNEAWKELYETGFGISNMLIVASNATVSTPRKKLVVYMEKGINEKIVVKHSSYDTKTGFFSVSDETVRIDQEKYLKSEKTILCYWKESCIPEEIAEAPKYRKAEEYKFSEEISVFYKVYGERKNKYAGVAYYREIKDTKIKTWGKKLTADIEKGLRADSAEIITEALEKIVFDDAVYPVIREDVEKKYIKTGQMVSLKTIWFYCWNYLCDMKKYDHEYMLHMFEAQCIAEIMPQMQTGDVLIDAIAGYYDVDIEGIPYKGIEQIDMILKVALKYGLILFDPLEPYIGLYTYRANERQQDVRNALVKKHFSRDEEEEIFSLIIGAKRSGSQNLSASTEKSLFLAVAIRFFTGMAVREVAALKWGDYSLIPGTDVYQLSIYKFVDSKGRLILHSERENWKRFRLIPVMRTLSYLLNERKQYLLDKGIDEEYLKSCPIVMSEERISDLKGMKKVSHCRPSKVCDLSNKLVRTVINTENEVVLPDEENDLKTDFNRYHGDIFLSNFRHKANHAAYLTMGELNYIIGIDAPDTFSHHYCDFTNDFVQTAIAQKLRRWEWDYERAVSGKRVYKPSHGEKVGNMVMGVGPYKHGVAAVDMIVENHSADDVQVEIKCSHGFNSNKTVY